MHRAARWHLWRMRFPSALLQETARAQTNPNPKYPDSYKYPKLAELHWFLFNILAKNLHNSLHDVIVTLRCFYKLHFNTDLYRVNEHIRPYLDMIQ